MNENCIKAILYAYPKLRDVAEATEVAAENKALLSYKSPLDPLSDLTAVAEEYLLAARLRALCSLVESVLSSLNAEEKFLLEYKFFRRKTYLLAMEEESLPRCSVRSYFRRQNVLLQKLCLIFAEKGMDGKMFFEEFRGCDFLMRLYKKAERGEEQKITQRRGSLYQNSARSVSASCFFPLRTNTATAMQTATPRQIITIATTDSEEPSEFSEIDSRSASR